MMSSALNPTNVNDSTMPGDYESWPGPAARGGLLGGGDPRALSPQPMIPAPRTPFPRIPPSTPGGPLPPTGRTPFPRIPPEVPRGGLRRRRPPIVPRIRLERSPRRRRRPVIPDIVIERRHHCHSSGGRNRTITIPLDRRPTLGLRGQPTRVIEIERIPVRRHRRSEKVCYEYEYDDPPPPRLPPQPVIPPQPTIPAQPTLMIANPQGNSTLPINQQTLALAMNNPSIVPTTAAAATHANFLSNMSAETINNLPRQTVHLPPIQLPGNQVNANTELETIVFPAEIINPIDGSLSIIQANPGINTTGIANIGSIPAAPVQPQLINMPTVANIPAAPTLPPMSPAMAANPLVNRFQDLFQRLNVSQPQPQSIPLPPNPPIIRSTLPPLPPSIPRNNPTSNLSPMAQFNPRNNIMNNLRPMAQFDPGSSSLNNRPIMPSMSTSNIRNYPSINTQLPNLLNTGSYRPTGTTATTTPMVPSNIIPSSSANNMSYRPVSTTPYRSSLGANNTTYRPSNIAPSDLSDVGPYQRANITPYSNIASRVTTNPLTSRPPGYSASPPIEFTSTFTPFPRLPSLLPEPSTDSINPSTSSVSLTTPPNQSLSSTPKSILRNSSSLGQSNLNNYTELTSPNVMSSNDTIRKTTRFA